MTGRVRAVIAAGSNQGDRRSHLRHGVEALAGILELEAVSSLVESPPEGGADQRDYLNLVAVGTTERSPRDLLEALLRIEVRAGRVRRIGGGEPRTLDLDLIFHGSTLLREPDLIVPHPRWPRRPFVVQPLLELLPHAVDPETGRPLREIVAPEILGDPLPRRGRIRLPVKGGVRGAGPGIGGPGEVGP